MNKTVLEHFKDIKDFKTIELALDEESLNQSKEIEKRLQSKSLAEECWEIVKNKPFILQKLFENKGLENQQEFDKKYFFGTITEEEIAKVKEGLK